MMNLCSLMVTGGLLLAIPLTAADFSRGKELYQQQNYEEAVSEFQSLVDEAPDLREVRYYLALSLIGLGRLDDAQAQLDAIAKADATATSQADLKVARARISLARKQYSEATTTLNEVIEMNPNHLQARMLRAETGLHEKNYKTVAEDAEKAISLDTGNAYAYYYAGIAFSNMGRPDKMADYFQNFLKLAPQAPEAPKVQSLLRSLRR